MHGCMRASPRAAAPATGTRSAREPRRAAPHKRMTKAPVSPYFLGDELLDLSEGATDPEPLSPEGEGEPANQWAWSLSSKYGSPPTDEPLSQRAV